MLTSSGQAANFFAMFNIASCGDHIVASSSIYGGTFNLISVTMAKMGIETTFVSPDCTAEELEAAFQPNTKLVFGETIANPALTVLDIEKFAAAAHSHGVPLIVDNTFATPVNCRPIAWGADIVTHSTTKYMDGHGACVGGAIVDSGNFDWMAHRDKFPGLTTPDESYHGITYAEKFGQGGAFITKCTAQLMRDLGCTQSPQSAFMLNLGLESLHVRMPRHCENGQAVAEFLNSHPKIAYVNYCGLPGDKYHELAQKYQVDFVRYRAFRTEWPGMERNVPCRVETVREMQGGIYDRKRILQEIYPRLLATSQLTLGPVVGAWGALYRTDFLKKNQIFFFEEIKFSEDILFSAKVILCTQKFYYKEEAGIYHYWYNPDSISKSFREGRWESCKKIIEHAEIEFKNRKEYCFEQQLNWLTWFVILVGLKERGKMTDRRERKVYCKKLLNDPVVRKCPLKIQELDVPEKQKILLYMIKKNWWWIFSLI